LARAAEIMEARKNEAAEIISLECGKSMKSALSEVEAAIKCGSFIASAADEFIFQEIASFSVPGRKLFLVRQPIGAGALIVPFNNPMAGIAWKAFPALMCGNSVVVKAHELTPFIAVWFGSVLKDAGLPDGVYNVIQGDGPIAGAALVNNPLIKFVSFTGSNRTGTEILRSTSNRLIKVSVECGGKNPFIVCEDADIDNAVSCAVAGSFIDAGQRCSATSRIIVDLSVYGEFKSKFLSKVSELKVGCEDNDDMGAIICQDRLNGLLNAVRRAQKKGATLLLGGRRIHRNGYFMEPTVLEGISTKNPIYDEELFGPVIYLSKNVNLKWSIMEANNSKYRLSSAIHTKDMAKAELFINQHMAGVVRVNGPTHGSEPHVPFGGTGFSGNGWREPGLKSFEFYSDWKQVSFD
jgi:aldehyde dehydrogenase (NAD+)